MSKTYADECVECGAVVEDPQYFDADHMTLCEDCFNRAIGAREIREEGDR